METSNSNKIGEIGTYYKNFEFSMEVKHSSTNGKRQLVSVGPNYEYSSIKAMIYILLDFSSNKMWVHFWRDGKDFEVFVSTGQDSISYFTNWHKVRFLTFKHTCHLLK